MLYQSVEKLRRYTLFIGGDAHTGTKQGQNPKEKRIHKYFDADVIIT